MADGTQVAVSGAMAQNQGSSLLVFIAGVAVGAVVSALYAPTSGKALRRRIGRAAEDGADMAHDAMDQAEEFVRDTSESARKAVRSTGDSLRQVRDEAASATE